MTPRSPIAQDLVHRLALAPHPEGGFYREVFRSQATVRRAGSSLDRSALTTIHFLLADGAYSRWHRVWSDEVWHFAEGSPLELFWIEPSTQSLHTERLDLASAGGAPVAIVPAGCWQAARTLGDFSLVSCSVGPGFEFADFTMLSDLPADAAALRARFPTVADMIDPPPG